MYIGETYPFVNLPLNYSYDFLEPYIDTFTMELHHSKHLQSYIDNLNRVLLPYPALQKLSLQRLIIGADRLPRNIRNSVKNNSGGIYNHRFFFDGLTNSQNKYPIGALADGINRSFGNFENFMRQFKSEALNVFGSGYTWLIADKNGGLKIINTANQNTPLTDGFCPVLNLDLWEHSYYLLHQNRRSDYIDNWFNVINWAKAEERYINCIRNPKSAN